MALFKPAYKVVMQNEGGYANNPRDRGGETWKGIARKMHPNWIGWKIVDSLKGSGFPSNLYAKADLQVYVEAFYKSEFWDVLRLDTVHNQAIANELFDTAVNMGTGTAAVFLQRVLNVTNRNGAEYHDLKLDGNIGPVTLSALNNHPRPGDVLKALNCLQGEKYIAICEADPSQETFFAGWMKRVAI